MLPQVATKLGCNPKEHFRFLASGQSVTLDNGNVITSDMVTEKPATSQACELVFMPNDSYVESFLDLNARFHEQL